MKFLNTWSLLTTDKYEANERRKSVCCAKEWAMLKFFALLGVMEWVSLVNRKPREWAELVEWECNGKKTVMGNFDGKLQVPPSMCFFLYSTLLLLVSSKIPFVAFSRFSERVTIRFFFSSLYPYNKCKTIYTGLKSNNNNKTIEEA